MSKKEQDEITEMGKIIVILQAKIAELETILKCRNDKILALRRESGQLGGKREFWLDFATGRILDKEQMELLGGEFDLASCIHVREA